MVLFKYVLRYVYGYTNTYLHSTMVLFKLSRNITSNIITGIFTFHYGPIQIAFISTYLNKFINLHSTMVLFKLQPGSICTKHIVIYIPLWSYSNLITTSSYSIVPTFTFHYGPIQILLLLKYEYDSAYIYIPLWSYSN